MEKRFFLRIFFKYSQINLLLDFFRKIFLKASLSQNLQKSGFLTKIFRTKTPITLYVLN